MLSSIFCWAFDDLAFYAIVLSVPGFLMVVIGTVSSYKKPIRQIDIDQFLIINTRKISIREAVYPIAEIKHLYFYFHSFYSQSSKGYFTETSGFIEHGMANVISFNYNGRDVYEQFFLADQSYANAFLLLTEKLQKNGILFKIRYRYLR